jgi:hypothetical protein
MRIARLYEDELESIRGGRIQRDFGENVRYTWRPGFHQIDLSEKAANKFSNSLYLAGAAVGHPLAGRILAGAGAAVGLANDSGKGVRIILPMTVLPVPVPLPRK